MGQAAVYKFTPNTLPRTRVLPRTLGKVVDLQEYRDALDRVPVDWAVDTTKLLPEHRGIANAVTRMYKSIEAGLCVGRTDLLEATQFRVLRLLQEGVRELQEDGPTSEMHELDAQCYRESVDTLATHIARTIEHVWYL